MSSIKRSSPLPTYLGGEPKRRRSTLRDQVAIGKGLNTHSGELSPVISPFTEYIPGPIPVGAIALQEGLLFSDDIAIYPGADGPNTEHIGSGGRRWWEDGDDKPEVIVGAHIDTGTKKDSTVEIPLWQENFGRKLDHRDIASLSENDYVLVDLTTKRLFGAATRWPMCNAQHQELRALQRAGVFPNTWNLDNFRAITVKEYRDILRTISENGGWELYMTATGDVLFIGSLTAMREWVRQHPRVKNNPLARREASYS